MGFWILLSVCITTQINSCWEWSWMQEQNIYKDQTLINRNWCVSEWDSWQQWFSTCNGYILVFQLKYTVNNNILQIKRWRHSQRQREHKIGDTDSKCKLWGVTKPLSGLFFTVSQIDSNRLFSLLCFWFSSCHTVLFPLSPRGKGSSGKCGFQKEGGWRQMPRPSPFLSVFTPQIVLKRDGGKTENTPTPSHSFSSSFFLFLLLHPLSACKFWIQLGRSAPTFDPRHSPPGIEWCALCVCVRVFGCVWKREGLLNSFHSNIQG